MNFIRSLLIYICIIILGKSNSSFGYLFLCTSDKHYINIELECPGDKKINIIDAWDIVSTHTYICGNNASSFTEKKYGLSNELTHKLLTRCFYQRKCMVILFLDEYDHKEHHGIGIKYTCDTASKFINVCESIPKKALTEVYLIDQTYERSEHSRCHCDITYHGRFSATLTHFPTEWVYLKVQIWSMASRREEVYKDYVYKDKMIDTSPDTNRQLFTVVNNGVNRKEDRAFLLVRISAIDVESNFDLQCYGAADGEELHSIKKQSTTTVQTPSATIYAATASAITALCLIAIFTGLFFIYRRFRTEKPKLSNANMTSPGVVNTVARRNVNTSVYVDCGDSLSHSYAEIGSISDYRHYVMPDDTSQQSLKVKGRYKTLVEECHSVDSKINSLETSHAAFPDQRGSPKTNGGKNNDENKSDNRIASRDNSDTVQDKCVDNTTHIFLEVKSKPGPRLMSITESADRKNGDTNISVIAKSKNQSSKVCMGYFAKMIPNERYDPSGYIDLDVPENTSNANLIKWNKEVYSVEQMARAKRANPLDTSENSKTVGKREVAIVQKRLQDTPLEQRYDCTQNSKIVFTEDEPDNELDD